MQETLSETTSKFNDLRRPRLSSVPPFAGRLRHRAVQSSRVVGAECSHQRRSQRHRQRHLLHVRVSATNVSFQCFSRLSFLPPVFNPPRLLISILDHPPFMVCITRPLKNVSFPHRYIYKGPDRSSFAITEAAEDSIDTIKRWKSLRCLTATEAAWRCFIKKLPSRTPAAEGAFRCTPLPDCFYATVPILFCHYFPTCFLRNEFSCPAFFRFTPIPLFHAQPMLSDPGIFLHGERTTNQRKKDGTVPKPSLLERCFHRPLHPDFDHIDIGAHPPQFGASKSPPQYAHVMS